MRVLTIVAVAALLAGGVAVADPVLENGWDNGFFTPFNAGNAATVVYGDSGWLGGPNALPIELDRIELGLVAFDSPTAGTTDITVTFNDGDPSGLVFGSGAELYRTTLTGVTLPATVAGEAEGFTLDVPLPDVVTSGGFNNVGWSVSLANYAYAGSFGFQTSTFSNFTTGFATNNASYFDGSAWSLFAFGPDPETQSANFVATITAVPKPLSFDVAAGGSRRQGEESWPVINSAESVTKTGGGTLVFDALNRYAGPTVIAAGTLSLAYDQAGSVIGTIDGSSRIEVAPGATFDVTAPTFFTEVQSFFLADGQTLAGGGDVSGAVTVAPGAAVSPGSGVGTLSITGGASLSSGGMYDWQLLDAAGTAGDTAGWDVLSVGGFLDITATPEEPFTINLWSLSAPGTDGAAAGFDPSQSGSWTIATASGVAGFSADVFRVVTEPTASTGGFANDLRGGSFSLAENGTSLELVFTPGAPPTDVVIDVPSGSQTQAEAGYATIAAADSVTKTGVGRLVFNAANAYTGPTTVSAGTLEVAAADALVATAVTVDTGATLAIAPGTTMQAPSVIVEGGTLSAPAISVAAGAGIASLAINAGGLAAEPVVTVAAAGELALAQDARVAVSVGGLAVDEASGGGRIDLGAGQVAIAAGGISAADLRADIIAGRNGGGWDGNTGITSSAAAAAVSGTRAVGYVVNADGSAAVSFAAPGDVDLTGQVNVFDLLGIDTAGKYGSGLPSVWSEGDFNYDGITNVFDLLAIDAGGAYGGGNYFPASPGQAAPATAAIVPEPGSLVAAAAAAAGLTRWRRRRPGSGRG
jgi:autotransporter-associated beta strand protein